MRIPKNHFLLHQYIKDFGLQSKLFPFEMENKFIYVSGYGETLTYTRFNELLVDNGRSAESQKLLALFPGLKKDERGQTCDTIFSNAVTEVLRTFWDSYNSLETQKSASEEEKIKRAYGAVTAKYDRYSLRSFLTERAHWSQDAINLYDLGNAHVVFENGFIESFKDAFLSSNNGGKQAHMEQLQPGMDAVPNAFISPERGDCQYIFSMLSLSPLMDS